MMFVFYNAITVAAATLRQPESPNVVDYLDKLDVSCTRDNCVKQLTPCADGADKDCLARVECLDQEKRVDADSPCLMDDDHQEMKWTELDDTEVQILDCAHSHKCMPDEWEAKSSFLEMLSTEMTRRGLDEQARTLRPSETSPRWGPGPHDGHRSAASANRAWYLSEYYFKNEI